MCAKVILDCHCKGKQDALAAELLADLRLGDKRDIRSQVFRYLNGELVNSGVFEAVHLAFWRTIVRGDYPLSFLVWLERAYATYDSLEEVSKCDAMPVRALLGEAHLLFSATSAEDEQAFARYEAARQLMMGLAAAVEQRTLKTGPHRVKEGIANLESAIRFFGTLKPGADALSASDKFHMAVALHLMDWLFSELPSEGESLRKANLPLMDRLGALNAYEWQVQRTQDWQHQYNIAEIHGELSLAYPHGESARRGADALMRAIRMNPRLADFDAETKFDGVDEPLSKAPALQRILPMLRDEQAEFLADCLKVYRRHAGLYAKDAAKGITAMLQNLEEMKAPALLYALTVVGGAVAALMMSSFVIDCVLYAKPIF
jgi:hypothetical protein